MASIFERMAMITKANVNELLEKFEDPEKMIDQAIIDAKKEYAKVVDNSLTVFANEKMVHQKKTSAEQEAAKWHNIAANALKSGNEDDARKALEKENEYRSKAQAHDATYQSAKAASDKLRKKLDDMKAEIADMENKSEQIKAKAVTAKAIHSAEKVSKKGINRGAFDAFDRMEAKADKQLAAAEALEDLNRDRETEDAKDLEKKYASGASNADDALANLKKELGM